jgi:hypothetical protein
MYSRFSVVLSRKKSNFDLVLRRKLLNVVIGLLQDDFLKRFNIVLYSFSKVLLLGRARFIDLMISLCRCMVADVEVCFSMSGVLSV